MVYNIKHIYIYIYTYVYIYTYIYISIYIHTYICFMLYTSFKQMSNQILCCIWYNIYIHTYICMLYVIYVTCCIFGLFQGRGMAMEHVNNHKILPAMYYYGIIPCLLLCFL